MNTVDSEKFQVINKKGVPIKVFAISIVKFIHLDDSEVYNFNQFIFSQENILWF